MAVRIKFDSTHNIIPPTFVLATRSGHKLGAIPATNVSISDSFNSSFELSFQVLKTDNGKEYHLWDNVTDFKLCWCREWDIWFEIYVEIQDDSDTVKNVTCVSLGEAELSQINLYDIEINTEDDIERDDYTPATLYNAEKPKASILHRIMEKAPHYSIAHVDASIKDIQRSFSFGSTNLYDAFQEIAEEIDCIFVIDSGSNPDGSIRRSINVYDLEAYCADCGHRDVFTHKCSKCQSENIIPGYGNDTTIFVSTENLADNITLRTDNGSVKNCFRLEGGDDLMTATIRSCNPNGSQYIWYISEDTKKDMSDGLVNKLDAYDDSYAYYQSNYKAKISSSLITKYNALVTKYKKYNEDLKSVSSDIIGYPSLMTAYYDTVDMYWFLHDALMPTREMSDTTAEKQAALLTATALSPVAVQSLERCSSATASNAVLSAAKLLIDSRYQVKVINGNLAENKWTGQFRVTNYSDETDTADSQTITVTLTDNYATYIKQKLEKSLSKDADSNETDDIISLFKMSLVEFTNAIEKYSLTSLNTLCNSCQSCLDILVEQGAAENESWANTTPNLYEELYLPYYNKLLALQSEIQKKEQEIEYVVGSYDADGTLETDGLQTAILKETNSIQDKLNLESYLGESLWLEFISYRREDTYSNDNYISDGLNNEELFKRAQEFIETAKKEIYKSATLQHSLTATLKNLLVMKEFAPIVDYFEVGNWIRVKIDNVVYRLRLISYEIDFEDLENISIEFSDVKRCANGVSDSQDILNQASSMASSYDSVARQASNGDKGNKKLNNWVDKGLELTNMKIMNSADNQNVMWDSHGMLFRKYDPLVDDYEETQLKVINSTLAITSDNWKHVKTAIGGYYFVNPETGKTEYAYGVNAETLVGKVILGEHLGIYSGDNSMTFDSNGLVITNEVNTFSVNPNGNKLLCLSNKDGDALWVDKNGKLYICGDGAGLDISANDTTNNLSSRITQNADSITAEVNRAQEAEIQLSGSITTLSETMSSKIEQTAESITSTVTKEIEKETKRAQTAENKLSGEISSLSVSMSSKIEQTADSITAEVSKAVSKYDTSSYTVSVYGYAYPTTAGYAASDYNGKYYLNQTNGYLYKSNGTSWSYVKKLSLITDNLSSRITQNANAIALKVSKGDVESIIEQNADSIRLKASRISWSSTYSSMTSSGTLTCQNATIKGTLYSENGKDKVYLRNGRLQIWYNGVEIGLIGGNGFEGYSDKEGLNFDLENTGDYMTWAAQDAGGGTYKTKWTYARNAFASYSAGMLNAGCDIDMHYWKLRNVSWADGGISQTINYVQVLQVDSDGTLARWGNNGMMRFKNGILVDLTYYTK